MTPEQQRAIHQARKRAETRAELGFDASTVLMGLNEDFLQIFKPKDKEAA